MVEKSVRFVSSARESILGAQAICALAVFKASADANHPFVTETVSRVLSDPDPGRLTEGSCYGDAVCLILLSELSPQKYQAKISGLANGLVRKQAQNGAWTYPNSAITGDTSQTQYAILALWTARRNGVTVSADVFERAAHWLARTQDVGGGFAYTPTDPGQQGRLQQPGVNLSMSAAGVGALYICGDALGVSRFQEAERTPMSDSGSDLNLPKALRKVGSEVSKGPEVAPRPTGSAAVSAAIRRSLVDANRWFASNYRIDYSPWQFYYLYSFERFQSFRELAEGRFEAEPRWYDEGVRLLAGQQQNGGGFSDADGGSHVNTAFAILFLLRSTKKTLEKIAKGDGSMKGGRGLPSNQTSDVQVKDGRLIVAPAFRQVDDLMSILSESEGAIDRVSELPVGFQLSSDPGTRKAQVARLRRAVSGGGYQARRVAVRILGRSGEFEQIPTLLFALSDPDAMVFREAHDALLFLSRKFQGTDIPEAPSPEFRKRVEESWRRWYRSVRPDLALD